ncbi:MAG: aspartate kinase [Aureliella sp.]
MNLDSSSRADKVTGVRVAKLGGSLLSLTGFAARLENCLNEANQRNPLPTILMVGGGGLIDAVRELDALHGFNARQVHHECIGLLSCTARLTRQLLPTFEYLVGEEQIQRFVRESTSHPGRNAIVDVERAMPFITREVQLPEDWSTTTDALSAALAIAANAQELLILKSAEPPVELAKKGDDKRAWLDALAAAGYIDQSLPALAASLPCIQFKNLRRL